MLAAVSFLHVDGYKHNNSTTCGAAGVIPLVVTALSAHGARDARIAWEGCEVLRLLAYGDAANADAIVIGTGGLDAILAAMSSFPDSELLQWEACRALYIIVHNVSPAGLACLWKSNATVTDLLNTAGRLYPDEGDCSVKDWVDLALMTLRRRLP